MRRALFLVGASLPFALAAACASSEAEPSQSPPSPDASTLVEAGPVEAAASPPSDGGSDGDVASACSAAGWCATVLPGVDLVLKDIWPLAHGNVAFAIAESPTIGIKVLAWNKTSDAWTYIDDETQNEPGYGKYAGAIWAADEADVYFTVAPGTVYHGTRPDPSAPFTWERATLPDLSPDDPNARGVDPHDHGNPINAVRESSYPTLGVWGTSKTDVYAWYANAVFRRMIDKGGAAVWEPEYVADDVDVDQNPEIVEHIYITGATGSAADGVWFSGVRDRFPYGSSCPLLVKKVEKGYVRVGDGTLAGGGGKGGGCEPREDTSMLGGDGWLTDIQLVGPERLFGLKGRDVLRLEPGKGGYAVDVSEVPMSVTVFKSGMTSLWTSVDGSAEEVWLSGFGLVLRGTDIWGKDTSKSYGISTISLNGAPTARPVYRVRGTSPHDLWAVGANYALHKTTP